MQQPNQTKAVQFFARHPTAQLTNDNDTCQQKKQAQKKTHIANVIFYVIG